MKPIRQTLTLEKSTPETHVYAAPKDAEVAVRSLYISKKTFAGQVPPARIVLSIEAEAEL